MKQTRVSIHLPASKDVQAGWYNGFVTAVRQERQDSPWHAGRTMHLIQFDFSDPDGTRHHWFDLSNTRWKKASEGPDGRKLKKTLALAI